jgi:hypothetical protein
MGCIDFQSEWEHETDVVEGLSCIQVTCSVVIFLSSLSPDRNIYL